MEFSIKPIKPNLLNKRKKPLRKELLSKRNDAAGKNESLDLTEVLIWSFFLSVIHYWTQEIASQLDESVDPCNDFYSYACGGFFKTHKLTTNESEISALMILSSENLEVLRHALENVSRYSEVCIIGQLCKVWRIHLFLIYIFLLYDKANLRPQIRALELVLSRFYFFRANCLHGNDSSRVF